MEQDDLQLFLSIAQIAGVRAADFAGEEEPGGKRAGQG
jgi:hypothetical protein